MHTIALPGIFWRDHAERELPAGTLLRDSGSVVVIQCGDADLAEIEDDARHYAGADAPDWEDGRAIRNSAKRTVDAIRRYRNRIPRDLSTPA